LKTILIVDDNVTNQQITLHYIQKLGYLGVIAENGKSALILSMKKNYHLILMDCEMPTMDGFEATQKIRKTQGPNQFTPIIALTGNIYSGIKKKCHIYQMNDLLNKPINLLSIKSILHKWL
jgi:CheY-like chemotaxis protein